MRTTLALVLISASLSFAGCKKKAEDAGAAKTVEGSAAAGSAATGSAAQPAATGSAAPTGEPAGSADPAAAKAPDPAAAKNIVDTAKGVANLSTFVKAVDAAGLTATLGGAGPFTVLAPTDEAFAKIPAKDLEALLADKAKLEALLQFHVVPGAVASKDFAAQKAVKSVQGAELAIDGGKIVGATVVTPDLAASNGVIHAIDTVLQPPAAK